MTTDAAAAVLLLLDTHLLVWTASAAGAAAQEAARELIDGRRQHARLQQSLSICEVAIKTGRGSASRSAWTRQNYREGAGSGRATGRSR